MKKVSVIALAVAVAIAGSVFAEEKAAEKTEAAKVEKHALAVKDGVATQCGCAAACDKCKLGEDGKKCTCGKDVESVKVTGKFACAKCAVVADKAGKCAKCATDLAEVKAKEEKKAENK